MKRILAVDDDSQVLSLEKKVLVREGYEVVTVESGAEAIEKMNEQKFDLILLDVMMPGLDGFEVSRKLREAQGKGGTPIVFVTAKDDAQAMREGFRSGGTLFLSKPFNSSQLVRVVRSIIR